MSVQRYVFRYAPNKPHEGYSARCKRLHPKSTDEWVATIVERDRTLHAKIYADRPYEKEGGGLTTELSQAKIVGWKSAKKWAAEESFRGDLIPVRIVIDDMALAGMEPASGIEAPSGGETGNTGSTEGESPAPKGGDAQ